MSLLVLSSSLRLLTRRAALTSALLSSPSLGAATARLPTPRRSAASKSSQAYIARQRTDHFVVARGSFRSRAAFKLQDLAAKYKLLKPSVQTVVDLGAAPGGWSQVLTQGKGSNTRAVVAVDLLDMEKIPGVHFVKGDFLDPRTRLRIRDYLIAEGGKNGHNKADLVLSDSACPTSRCQRCRRRPRPRKTDGLPCSVHPAVAANVSGSMEKDAEAALQIAESCYELRPSPPSVPFSPLSG